MKKHAVFAAVAGLFAMSAHAQGPGISASVGTTGLGLHLSVPVLDKVSARVGANAFNYDYSGSTDEVDYDFDLKLKTFDALLDYRPFGGTFRLTTGAVRNGNKVTAQARPNSGQTYTINGRTYSAAQAGTIDGKIDFKKVAPYLGFGWGSTGKGAGTGFGFTADFGVLFQGTPRTSLASNGCSADPVTCEQLRQDVTAESARLNDDVRDFKLYPVARIGIMYRF